LQTADFDYFLPPDHVAVVPSQARDDSRLLVMDRRGSGRKHLRFRDILPELPRRALVVVNDTRVFPARLRGRKPTGGAVEYLLTRCVSTDAAAPGQFSERWEGLGRGLGSGAQAAATIGVGGGVTVELIEQRASGRVLLRLAGPGVSLLSRLDEIGEVPLPPYIEAARRKLGGTLTIDDKQRYQTVFAADSGAVAAPTAGLHFTPELLAAARDAGHDIVAVTLDVGPGTFRPVETSDPHDHRLDPERYRIPATTAAAIARARADGRAVVAVGTTVVRTLEAAARTGGGHVAAGDGETDLYLLPGERFLVVTDLITNFHLPRSTLLMLVAAFAERQAVLDAYREAISLGYRFYSYGDAMLIRSGSGAS
jgi:S-adenosylmethionine:tRNA ribosyltransferase-isomerase